MGAKCLISVGKSTFSTVSSRIHGICDDWIPFGAIAEVVISFVNIKIDFVALCDMF